MKKVQYIIPASLFLGIAIGLLFNRTDIGVFLGLGIGMLLNFIFNNK